jgi:hypothetical protein
MTNDDTDGFDVLYETRRGMDDDCVQPPVAEQPTWYVIDSTKLSEYQQCPRRFFYKYILGWRLESERNDLWFGTCWHMAMEHILLNGYEPQSILDACLLFESKYREKYSDLTDDLYFPKVPGVVMRSLPEYCGKYYSDIAKYEVLYTEVAGTVPIAEGRVMHFKIDSILRDRRTNKVRSREHKTGSRNSRVWQDKFKMSIQVGTYDHALRCMFGPELVDGIEINGAIFSKGDSRKGEHGKWEFPRIEIIKYPEMSNVWLWNTNRWADLLDADMFALRNICGVDDTIMPAFIQNTESCTDYWGCPYMDFCLTWANPLHHTDIVPIGFIEEHWDPRADEAIRTRVAL